MPGVIVGRDRPLAVLAEGVGEACAGRGGLVLVTGDPGIGKTAILTEAAAGAATRGALVLSGTCWDGEGTPGYWPWIQVVRGLRRAAGAQWPALRQAGGEGLGRLLGEQAGAPAGRDGGEFQLFDAVTTLLVSASTARPLLVVIDDLQWADPASVRMLDFVARHTTLAGVLVAAAYRDTEAESAGHPLRALLGQLAGKAATLALAGLDEAAVGELVARAGLAGAGPGVIAEISRRTGGNPFFVEQAARLWSLPGAGRGVPPGVREAVERRLARLPSASATLLATAALLGAEFSLPVAAAAAGLTPAEAERALSPAVTARLVAGSGEGTFRFVHDLVRDALRESPGEHGGRRGHAAIIAAVAAQPSLAARLLPGQLAGHAYLALPDTDPAAAAGYLLAAGDDAARRLAAEEACGHYRRALEVIGSYRLAGRQDVALRLGTQQQRAGQIDAARRTFSEVVSAARDAGDPELYARGALGLHSLGHLLGGDAAATAELLGEAQSVLAAAPGQADGSPLLARLMAAASQARTHELGEDRAAGERSSAVAVEMARRCGDAEALGFSLLAHHDAIWRPGTAARRRAVADELTGTARRAGDRELELEASLLRAVALLEDGDPAGLAEFGSFAALAEQTRLPRFRYLALSRLGTIATVHGRFADARRHIEQARELGGQVGVVDAGSVWHDQAWELARLQGRWEETDALLADGRARGDPLALVVEAVSALDRGQRKRALALRGRLEELVGRWPRWAWLMWLTFRAELAAASGNPAFCAAVRAEIEPVAGQWAVLAGAVAVHGPMCHWAAVVDAGQRHWDEALASFAEAERLAEQLMARPWSLLARLGTAGALLGRAAPGDAAAAAELLAAVVPEAEQLGMAPAAARGRQLQAAAADTGGDPGTAGAGPASPASAAGTVGASTASTAAGAGEAAARAGSDPGRAVFRRDGEVWTLAFGGRTALLPDSKGLRDLHVLLASPGTDIPATALLAPAGGELVTAASRLGGDAVLDAQAKAAYRARLTALDEEIGSALDAGEDQRAARIDGERQGLIDELRRATGLGGRPRRLGAASERARKTVTARIRDTLRRLDDRHPPLASHLRGAVSTGTTCRYQPAGDITWEL